MISITYIYIYYTFVQYIVTFSVTAFRVLYLVIAKRNALRNQGQSPLTTMWMKVSVGQKGSDLFFLGDQCSLKCFFLKSGLKT